MNRNTRSALDRMAAQRFPSDDALGDTDEMSPRLLNELRDTSPRPVASAPTRRPVRRRVLVAAGIVAVAAVGSIVVVPHLNEPTAFAETAPALQYLPGAPKGTARDLLTELAARAQAQPPAPGSGPYHYVHTRSWSLGTGMTTEMKLLWWRIEKTEREQWSGSDGSGRILVRGERPEMSFDKNLRPGELDGSILAGSPEALQAKLAAQNPRRTAAGWFNMWNTQVVSPELQSALLRNLAAQPGLTVPGMTTDRAGREGIAFSAVDSDETPVMRYVMVLDPNTGMLLDFEKIALENFEDIPMKTPATTGYTVWLGTGYTASTTERP
ncbi:MAG TPA: CU044_5270 family protein [Mycobacteriales bacterium]